MTLYVAPDDAVAVMVGEIRPASPSEILAAAGEHVDYEAAAMALYNTRPEVTSGRWPPWEDLRSAGRSLYLSQAKDVVNAALGAPVR